MIYYVFSFQPCANTAPFEPLPGPRSIGFTTSDDSLPGEYLGNVIKGPDGQWYYNQRTVYSRLRLTPANLRAIADRIEHLQNEEEKLRAKDSKLNRQTQSGRKEEARQARGH